ncbi:aminoacyl-tRNA deacylase [Anaerococcus porci]|uniref:aminoacyl-tRNA deacylase n=1 Tax=Anaerococcus porci TaxID=2652269 RepID=UPI002A7666F5|nr:aminoacyl-tRNA deacylase [Anaerococcus porci]MDY3005420.1 aminoacyl-tRNA deacylase [Anaerococcus porci]
MANTKTNAMRILENNNIEYEEIEYDLDGEFISAVDAGEKAHEDLDIMFKTIACISKDGDVIIYLVRSYDSIDMKKAAKIAGVKSISILPTKKLKSTVGYQRGETSPLAMKKDFPVFIDDSAKELDKMIVSGGKVGVSIVLNPKDLAKVTRAKFENIRQ